MQRKKVKSSNIVSIGYENNVLEIEFKNGIYQYIKVPEEIFKGLMAAESHGKYFYLHIKGKFDFVKQINEENEMKADLKMRYGDD